MRRERLGLSLQPMRAALLGLLLINQAHGALLSTSSVSHFLLPTAVIKRAASPVAVDDAAFTPSAHRIPGLMHDEVHSLDQIGQHLPCLLEAISEMDEEEAGYVDELFAEVTGHTDYLTRWGGADSEKAHQTLRLALDVAYLAHRGQKRRSGEQFIVHPVQVASILAQSNMDLASLTAGLLHDTVEDTDLLLEDVEALFGQEVKQIVEGETKVSKLPKVVRAQLGAAESPPSNGHDKQAENLRSMFIAMADDWRIVVVKLADRLHNMRTLQYMPPHKRIAIARETLEIFTPLAHRLGMWQFKVELADLSFAYLFPEEHEQIKQYIEEKAMGYRAATAVAGRQIRSLLDDDPLLAGRVSRVSIERRTKSIHSTWRKMQRSDCTVERVHDLLALRIILDVEDSVGENKDADAAALCYHVLGRVHGLWTPMPRTIKDYISSPKPNGYRSLHTTVLIGTGIGDHEEGAQPLEVQIRTASMHAIAEHGAAAHWSYSQEGVSLPWRTAIRDWEAKHQCAHEFMQLVRKELLSTRVFIFTQGGRILDLALGATIADAADTLGVDIGDGEDSFICSHNMCEAASLDTPLSNGDIVCFDSRAAAAVTGDERYPSASITAPAHPSANHDVRSDGGEERGKSSDASDRPQRRTTSRAHEHSAIDLVDGCLLDEMRWTTCENCLPLPGDALVCTLIPKTRGGTMGLVHRASEQGSHMSRCKELRKQLADGSQLFSGGESMCELVEVAFEPGRFLTTSLVVFLSHESGALLAATAAVTADSLEIVDVASRINAANATHPSTGAFQFRVQVGSLEQLDRVTTALDALPQVLHVQRSTLDMMLEESADAFWQKAYKG